MPSATRSARAARALPCTCCVLKARSDVVCNEIPRAFSDHRPYAICSFVGGWVMVLAHAAHLPQWGALLAAAGTATALRAAAVAMDWRLPAWQAGAMVRDAADDPPQR